MPKPKDADVLALKELHELRGVPVLIKIDDKGYDARQCHISAKHHAIKYGGRRVHGWALWRWLIPDSSETMVMAEHHSVWETPDHALIDLTPSPAGSDKVLFIRDDSAEIVSLGPALRMRTQLSDRLIRIDPPGSPETRYIFGGKGTHAQFYPLQPELKPDAVEYAERLGFDLSRFKTEDDDG